MSQQPDPHHEFHSHETGEPFVNCISCGLNLDDPELPFLVAKSFRGDECIFEYAICEQCRANMAEEFSQESRQRLAGFFHQRVDLDHRARLAVLGPGPAPWIAHCAACRKSRDEMDSFSIGGLLLGSEILFDPYPLCLCGQCEEEIQEILSKETRDIWDDFVDTHFDGPPAHVLDLPIRGRPLVF